MKLYKRNIVETLLMLGLLTLFASAQSEWGTGKKYALIIGIDDYQNEQVVDLQYAGADAQLLKEALIEQADFGEENIFVLSSSSTEESLQPSLTNIVFRLEWFRDIVGPGDTLIFYFAGHGVNMDDETFLLTEEADERSKGTLMISSLKGSTLYGLLDSAGAQNTLVFLDACRNDPTAGRGDSDNRLTENMARGLTFVSKRPEIKGLEKNTATVFACSKGERSWEWSDKKHGFFTYFLVDAIKGGASQSNGEATLASLMGYVRDNVISNADKWLGSQQTPMMHYEGPDPSTWVLSRNLSSATVASQDPEKTKAARERAALIARTEAAELEAKKAKSELTTLQAKRDVEVAEKEVLVRENALLQAKQDGGDSELAAQELELAQDNLNLARQGSLASADRLDASNRLYKEALVRVETSKLAQRVTDLAFGSQANDPGVAELQKQLTSLEQKLEILDDEKRSAVERALVAEQRVARLEAELNAKWAGRALGKRPTRRTRREDLWRVVDPGEEEATSL